MIVLPIMVLLSILLPIGMAFGTFLIVVTRR